MDTYKVIKEPHITEKGTIQKDIGNHITFKVHKKANKIEIRMAVEKLFNTKVMSVQTMNVKGKKRRMGKNLGKRPDWKKAIVKLAPDQNIEFFEGM